MMLPLLLARVLHTKWPHKLPRPCLFPGSKNDENLDDLKKELELDVHRITVSELCQRLGTNLETGLTNAQARANLERGDYLFFI